MILCRTPISAVTYWILFRSEANFYEFYLHPINIFKLRNKCLKKKTLKIVGFYGIIISKITKSNFYVYPKYFSQVHLFKIFLMLLFYRISKTWLNNIDTFTFLFFASHSSIVLIKHQTFETCIIVNYVLKPTHFFKTKRIPTAQNTLLLN